MRESTLAADGANRSASAVKPGEPEEFRDLFDRCHRQVLAYCRRRVQQSEAHDVAAEVFLVAWRRRRSRSLGDVELAWLYGIARRALANHHRTRARQFRLGSKLARQPVAIAISPEELVVHGFDLDQVRLALDSLRELDREVIRLAVWEGLRHVLIGEVLGRSPRAASMLLSRAMARLEIRRDPVVVCL